MKVTVTAFRYDAAAGSLTAMQTIDLLPGKRPSDENTAAEICMHPSGRFLYASIRGDDSVTALRIDPDTGRLSFFQTEPDPRQPSAEYRARSAGQVAPRGRSRFEHDCGLSHRSANGRACVQRAHRQLAGADVHGDAGGAVVEVPEVGEGDRHILLRRLRKKTRPVPRGGIFAQFGELDF